MHRNKVSGTGKVVKEKLILKDKLFHKDNVNYLAKLILGAHDSFDAKAFELDVLRRFPELELKERMYWIRECLEKYLPEGYLAGLKILLETLKDVEEGGDFIFGAYSEYVENNCKSVEDLEVSLKRVVFGQDNAIDALSSAIKLARAGLREPEKPIGNYLFAGPTGVGKTEVAKQLADTLGVEMLRFDMSEYMEKHAVAKLIGAPPGYIGHDQGGALTDAIKQHPHAVLLLDEIEKAHPDIFNILLQVMDHGVLTDSQGRKSDFRNTILIMTTNAGAREMDGGRISLGKNGTNRDMGKHDKAIRNFFSPEFRNRLDAIINFNSLSREFILQIVDKFLYQLELKLVEKRVSITVNQATKNWLAEKGYDPKMGARPLIRVIEDKISKPLSREILFGKLVAGGEVKVVLLANNQIGFNY